MLQTDYLYRGQVVIKTGKTANKKGRTGNVLQTLCQITPKDGPIPWVDWVVDSELYELTNTGDS